MSFKLGSIKGRAVLISEDNYYDLKTISEGKLSSSTLEALHHMDLLNDLNENLNNLDATGAVDTINFDSPVSAPKNCYAVGLNYRNHAEEAGMQIPEVPMIFTKHTTCLVGATSDIEMRSNYVDYEAELIVVIGRQGKNISKSEAWSHIEGVCIGQDISDRPAQFAASTAQFNLGKSFDTFGPIGPYIVTKDELPDFQKLNMSLDVDGKRMQTGNTEQMIFDIKTLVSYMSSCMSLHPGDICCTGTPPGVGENMSPPKFLKGGEEVILSIDKLGTQKHKVYPYK